MLRNCFFSLLILCLVVPMGPLFAITNDFRVRTLIGTDTIPPTVPTGLTATPVASSQIDLSWTPSTDDIELSGYHVWRDDILIATTTAPLYVDTGLTASTTYTYYVSAFDSFSNESATSTSVATTTFSIPVPPPPSVSGNKYGFRLTPLDKLIISLEIVPQKDSVIIRYETNMHIQSVIKWGKTSSYELGSLAEQAFNKTHETQIVGLRPGTLYYFTIEGDDRFGRGGTLYNGTFTTLALDDIFPPGNVTNLTAKRDRNDVLLSWNLPKDPDLSYIRVMRSDTFYPSDTADGWVVYEGLASSFRDKDIAVGAQQFYTVFSYDTHGNISSGAVTRIRFVTGGTTATTTPLPGEIDPLKNAIALSFNSIQFIQEGIVLPITHGTVAIDGSKQLTIALPYTLVPEHLKTILVVLGDNTDPERTFQFLLRVDPGRTAYTSTLAPLGVSGLFPVTVSIFDYMTSQIGYASGVIDAHIEVFEPMQDDSTGGFMQYLITMVTSYVFWFVLLIILIMFVGRRLIRKKT